MYHDLSSRSPSRQFMDKANGPTTSQNSSSSRKRPAPVELQLNRDQGAPQTSCSSQMDQYENSMNGSWTQAHSNTFDGNSMMPLSYLNEFTGHQNAGQNMRQPYFVHGWPVMHSSPMDHNFLTHAGQETHFSKPGYSQYSQQGYFCSPGHSASHPTEEIDGLGEIQSTQSESSRNTVESTEVQTSQTVVPSAGLAMTAETCYPKCSGTNVPESERAAIYPTFGTGLNLKECTVVEEIDGRLPAVGTRSKYNLTVDELRRRCGAPENMNISGLYGFIRKSKKKAYLDKLKFSLAQNDINVKHMQRQTKMTRFTPLLEEEALHLAQDVDNLTKTFMPVKEIGRQMLDKMILKGFRPEICAKMLSHTRAFIAHVLKTMEKRQPRVTGKEEKLKGNNLDEPYHIFSLVTHGFGHPNSLTFYKSYLEIIDHAVSLCERMKRGALLPMKKVVRQEQKPFEKMSEEAITAWKVKEREIEEERRKVRMYQNSQPPLQQININMQQPYFFYP